MKDNRLIQISVFSLITIGILIFLLTRPTPPPKETAPDGQSSATSSATVSPGVTDSPEGSPSPASPAPSAEPSPAEPSEQPLTFPANNVNWQPEGDAAAILYVGNEQLRGGSLPEQVSALASLYDAPLQYNELSAAGAGLEALREEALAAIGNASYDYVVLMDHAARPLDDPDAFLADMKTLCEAARAAGAEPVLFNPACSPGPDRKPDKARQAAQTALYEQAAIDYGAILINAGDAWVYAGDTHPDLLLYNAWNNPTDAGGYLSACTFVSTLFNLHVTDTSPDTTYQGVQALPMAQTAWDFVSYYMQHGEPPSSAVSAPPDNNEE